jgi:hypothetical protein
MMKLNPWTMGLLGLGLVSLPAITHAEERTNLVLTALSSTTISGYVDTSAQWNFGTGNQYAPNYAFGGPSKADGFNLNVVKLMFEKPLDATDSWSAGYKVDTIYGPDADAFGTQSTGVKGDFGVKQAYVALRAPIGNGLDFKMGVWDTIIGYEVFESVNNPNFTRSYGYTIEPVSHTGVLASYAFCESFSASFGVANTVGPMINERAFLYTPGKAESYKTYMGSVTFTAPSDWGFLAGSTLSGAIVNGFNSWVNTPSGADSTSLYVGGTFNTPVTGLKVGASYDYLGVSNQPLTDDTFGSGYANAAALYLSFAATEKLTLAARGEYATTDLGFYSTSPMTRHKIVAATATAQYDLWKNVVSRLEFRWDHSADGTPAFGAADPETGLPTRKNSYILMANIVYKF